MILLETGNPLLPEHLSELVVGLVLAALVVLGITKFVVPRFEQLYEQRTAEIEGGINRAQKVQAEAAAARQEYKDKLAASAEETAKIREEAHVKSASIIAAAEQEAKQRAEATQAAALTHIQVERDQAFNDLKSEVGGLATNLAEKLLGESLGDPAAVSRSVDRFLAELQATPASPAGSQGN